MAFLTGRGCSTHRSLGDISCPKRCKRILRSSRPMPTTIVVPYVASGSCSRAIESPSEKSYRCRACKALLREREQASVLVSFGRGRYCSVAELCNDSAFKELAIYEPGTGSPIRRYLRALPVLSVLRC